MNFHFLFRPSLSLASYIHCHLIFSLSLSLSLASYIHSHLIFFFSLSFAVQLPVPRGVTWTMDGADVRMNVDAGLDGQEPIVPNASLTLDVPMVHVPNPGHAIAIQAMVELLVKKNWTFVKRWTVIPVKTVEHVCR